MGSLCPICYTDITEATGHVVLSCSHKFHLSCVTTWFYSVEVETCPCCRRETCEKEKMPLALSEDEEEEEGDYVRLSNGNWVPRLLVTAENRTFEDMAVEPPVWRNVVEMNEETDLCARIIQSCYGLYRMRKEAAKTIQKVWRSHKVRQMLKRRSGYVAF